MNWVLDHILELTVVIILILVGFMNLQSRKITRLETKISELQDEVQKASNIAYRDCQIWMSRERLIQRVNGCYEGMELLCVDKAKNIKECEEILTPYCRNLGE